MAAGLIAALVSGGALLTAAGGAAAATGFFIKGAGFGHGVGMSQYGAAGYAQHGYGYRQILSHYYADTTLGQVSPSHQVRVLLKQGGAGFQGADTDLGPKTTLKPSLTYSVEPTSKGLLLSAGGHLYGVWKSPLIVKGTAPLDVPGLGAYRGELEFVQSGSRVDTINVVGIEDYVRGVVAAEMPPGWPAQALEAQAVAARTFAVATGAVSKLFNVYADTRSQVYRGVSAETPSSDAAVAATSGQVVEYGGAPALTYFFSSSGGYTESVQNVWQGVTPEAWLHGVPDPYDDSFGNPYYRWKQTLSVSAAAGDLKHYLKGSLKGIEVLQHGVSPRIVKAAVVGSRGTVDVTGEQLETLFGLRSTYASFTTITSRGVVSSGSGTADAGGEGATTTPGSGTVPTGSGGAATTGALGAGATTTTVPAGSGGAGVTPAAPATTSTPVPSATTGGIGAGGAVAPSAAAGSSALTDIVHDDMVGAAAAAAAATATLTGADAGAPIDADFVSAAAAVPLLTWQPNLTLRAARDLLVADRRRTPHRAVEGSAYPAAPGAVVHVQRAAGKVWRTVGSGRVTVAGTYTVPVARGGLYRVVLNGVDGPSVTVG